jgi:hypothetical protein
LDLHKLLKILQFKIHLFELKKCSVELVFENKITFEKLVKLIHLKKN